VPASGGEFRRKSGETGCGLFALAAALHSRTSLSDRLPVTPPKAQPIALRIELEDIEPLVWRRIVVCNQLTFEALHNYLQWVMGWQDSHAHEFRAGERCIGPDWVDSRDRTRWRSAELSR
jgi:hypothetical protein